MCRALQKEWTQFSLAWLGCQISHFSICVSGLISTIFISTLSSQIGKSLNILGILFPKLNWLDQALIGSPASTQNYLLGVQPFLCLGGGVSGWLRYFLWNQTAWIQILNPLQTGSIPQENYLNSMSLNFLCVKWCFIAATPSPVTWQIAFN